MPGRGVPRVQPQGGQYQRQAEQRQSEVRLRMGPVPSEWGFGRIKDAVHLITQVEAKYVSPIGPDQMVTVSFQDGPTAETAARGLNGRQLFAGGPTITATVIQPSAVANRAQMEWLDDGGEYGEGMTTDADANGGQWAAGDGEMSLTDVLNSSPDVRALPYELRPVTEIEGLQSRPGVLDGDGPVESAVSRRSTMEPINAPWGRPLEDGSMVYPESRISEFCDQWNCMEHGEGLSGSVMFSPTGNIRIVQDMQPGHAPE